LDFASAAMLCARDITLGHHACWSKIVRYGFEIPRAKRKLFEARDRCSDAPKTLRRAGEDIYVSSGINWDF
jgi:hypothetical protein